MYYQNYDDYMRDVFYFNQMPNQNMGYQNFAFNQQPNQMGQINPMNCGANYNNMYPSIYRIVQPVVSRVVTGSNYQYLTEDNLNSMVDTVYNIVEGDVMNSQENDNLATQPTSAQTTRTQTTTTTTTNNSTTNNTITSSRCNDNNQNATILLRDLIKILILKEIICRNNMRRASNNMMYPQQFYQNCYDQRCIF